MSSWKDFPFQSKVEDILKKQEFSLQELLDEDEVVIDTRHHKIDLIRFLSTEDNVVQLLSYLTSTPALDASAKEKFRYPVVACEILLSDNIEFQDMLITPKCLELLYGFFSTPTINLQKASLVIRIAIHLLQFRLKECLEYLRTHPDALLSVISHPEAVAVSAFIIRLMHCERDEAGILNWLVEIGVVTTLTGLFRHSYLSIHSDASNCIIDVITASVGTPLIDAFLTRDNCLRLIEYVKESPSSIRYGLNIFIALLKYIGDMPTVDYLNGGNKKPSASLADLPELVQVIVDAIPYLIDLLKVTNLSVPSNDPPGPPSDPSSDHSNDPSTPNQGSENHTNSHSFGYIRLRIIHVITTLLGLNFTVVNNAVFDSDILSIAFDLMLAFPQNNFAHQAIEALWSKAFEVAEGESCIKILTKTSIIKRLIQAETENTAAQQAGLLRKPYMPYLHQLAFTLQSITLGDVKSFIEQTEGWDDHISHVELISMPITERQRRGGSFRM